MTLSADQVAGLIIERTGAYLTAMQLQKLLYYTQAWHLAVTDEPLFTEQFKAWVDGPVIPQVWHSRRDHSSRSPSEQGRVDADIPQLSSDLLDIVLAKYGSMSGDELSALTHTETPWLEARAGLEPKVHSSAPVSMEAMASFYRRGRKLGGRTAADLASGGLYVRSPEADVSQFDIDEFLDSLGPEFEPQVDDEFGGANLATPLRPSPGTGPQRRRPSPSNLHA